MKNEIQLIHESSMRILARTGVKFKNKEAVGILKENGIRVEKSIAYFTEEQIMYWVTKAPSCFTLYARNPKYNAVIGKHNVNIAPGYGAPYISDQNGEKQLATMKDYMKLAKLYHQCPAYNINGGILVQPDDIPVDHFILLLFYAAYLASDKCIVTGAGKKAEMQALMEMACTAFGGREELAKYPRIITLINTNTPLLLDTNMTDSLITYARYRQPVIIASLAQAGLTSPVTMAGTIAMANAEVLAGIALSQMVSPGTPVVYGSQSTNADMRNGATAIGSAEGSLCYSYCADMARFYQLPSRAGGALTDARIVNAQSGYESMLTLLTCFNSEVNLVLHSSGILDSYASMSYDKLIQDFEIIDYIQRFKKGIVISEDTLAEDIIDSVGHNGQYLTEEHTFEHCRTESLAPFISVRGDEYPIGQLQKNTDARLARLLEGYQRPEADCAILEALRKIMLESGIEQDTIQMIDSL